MTITGRMQISIRKREARNDITSRYSGFCRNALTDDTSGYIFVQITGKYSLSAGQIRRRGLMKKIVCVVCLAVFSLSITLAPHLATAQPQGTGQARVPGVTNLSLSQSPDTSAQIQGLLGSIKNMQQTIEDAMKELKQDIDDLNQLRAEPPTGPQGNSSQDKDAYYKRRTEWQYKVTAKEHEIVAKQAKINQLQKQVSDLQQQLSNLQSESKGALGKKLTPMKVEPKK
jgi:hypothetical protein